MSRVIDRMVTPAKSRPVKVVVASLSRSGTLSMHTAMQILGFNSYHITECCIVGGAPHIKAFVEAIKAQYNRLSGIKRYKKPDFDKWMADYDCLVEIPSYMGKDLFEAYAEDPNVKFILTERQPEKWARSVNNSLGELIRSLNSFPLNILRYFDPTLKAFYEMNIIIYKIVATNTRPGDPDNIEELCRHYKDHIEVAKKYIPADRLHVIQLENGVDWNDICPFLGVPIPSQPYPPPNDPVAFQKMVDGFMVPRVRAAVINLSLFAIPFFGVIGWTSLRYGPSILASLRSI